jgi:hypothetical protein
VSEGPATKPLPRAFAAPTEMWEAESRGVSTEGRSSGSYDEFAVEVPGMSCPQIGFDDTGTKPFFSAFITHEH